MAGSATGEITLAAGEATVTLAPAVGGAIAAFQWQGNDVLRPTQPAHRIAGNVRQFACYPLVPYSNRIAQATLDVGAGSYPLARNFGDHPHPIHGVGWQRAWRLEAHDDAAAHARIGFDHVAEGEEASAWPFAFRATQAFALTPLDDGAVLTLTLALCNTGAHAFPFGLGWHPFFPLDATTEITFSATGVWHIDATCLPTTHAAPPPLEWRFEAPRSLGDVTLDNVFTGWNGEAEMRWPATGRGVRIEADSACSHLVVFVPGARDYIAIEPVTHMTDAFNRAARGDADTGTRWLGPGEERSCTMRIIATAYDRPR